MTDRTIDLPEHIYDELMELKNKNESIADYISRLIEKNKRKRSIGEFVGIFQDSSEEWKKIEKTLYSDRLRESNERTIKF